MLLYLQVFWLTEWKYKYYIDPALSILLVLLILHSVWPLLRDSALILLQTVPTHIQVDAIQNRLLTKVDGVLAVHEFHVWQLAGDRIIASAHIRWVGGKLLYGNMIKVFKLHLHLYKLLHNTSIFTGVAIYQSICKLLRKWKSFSTMKASIRQPFNQNLLTTLTSRPVHNQLTHLRLLTVF